MFNRKRMIGNMIDAKNMSVIFVIIASLIITPVGSVALASTQSVFGAAEYMPITDSTKAPQEYKPCMVVNVTNPPDGTHSLWL